HVERAVFAEAEAACSVVELRRGDAEIEQYAIAERMSCLRMHQRRKLCEFATHEVQASLVCKARAAGRNGRGVAVDGHNLPIRAKRLEDASSMTAATECRVDVETVRSQRKRLERLFDKHRRVLIQLP